MFLLRKPCVLNKNIEIEKTLQKFQQKTLRFMLNG